MNYSKLIIRREVFMSHYLNQETDFIHRTKEILLQYEKSSLQHKEKFEITLFLNCFVGLLILPQQHWFNKLSKDLISLKEWHIDPNHISIIAKGEQKSVESIARHLRNSVSHYRFKAFSNQKSNISKIKFEDVNHQGVITFQAVIPIINLRAFINKFSSELVALMDKEK